MARLFGTDGVRGVANAELTCELAFKLGQAGAAVLASNVRRPTILVGRDTRISGEMLESALVAGICSVGARAVLLGVLPTPGIAYLTRFYEADAGVVISASHNTVEYNGIKFFDRSGCKLPDAIEDRIEDIIQGRTPLPELPTGVSVGRPIRQVNAQRQYIEFLKNTTSVRFDGLNVVLDCAHGASSSVAPRALRELGAQVEPCSMPALRAAIPAYYVLASAEASSNLSRYDGIKYGYRAAPLPDGEEDLTGLYARTRSEGFGREVKRRVLLGTFALCSGYYDAYYAKAQRARALIRASFDEALARFDALLGPTAPTAAFPLGERLDDPLQMYLGDIYTVSVNLAGLPGLSIPCGADAQGLPVGAQLIAAPFGEGTLLRIAAAYQAATGHHRRAPKEVG